MADDRFAFLNDKNYASPEVDTTPSIDTAGKRFFNFTLDMDALAGNATHLLDVEIEECENDDWTPATAVRTLASFTQVKGDGSTGSNKQKIALAATVQPDRFIRGKVTTQVGSTSFVDIRLAALFDIVP